MYTFGQSLQHELDEVEGKTKVEIKRKRERIITKWLGGEVKYRNPIGPTRKTPELEEKH